MSESFKDRDGEDNIDDLVQTLSDALSSESVDDNLVDDLVNSIIEKSGVENPIVGHFVLVAEIIDSDGEPHLMVASSDNLPEWISRGMLSMADEYLSGINGGDWRDGG